ncbi:MAG: response regulator [Mariprofundaceae bacterium]
MAKILVTDDSNFLRRLTCRILEGAGHHTIEAINGAECLKYLEKDTPDAVFLDLVMPEVDGMAVLTSLKEQGHPVPVIVLTADIQDVVKEECLKLGAVSFINKPPKEDDVLHALQLSLTKKGLLA